jgi:hypothetical protein
MGLVVYTISKAISRGFIEFVWFPREAQDKPKPAAVAMTNVTYGQVTPTGVLPLSTQMYIVYWESYAVFFFELNEKYRYW